MKSSDSVPEWLKPFFWDVSLEGLNTRDHQIFIIERLLNEGTDDTLRWVFRTYSEAQIKDAVLAARHLSPKTARCWQNYFQLEEEELRCFGPFSTRPKSPR